MKSKTKNPNAKEHNKIRVNLTLDKETLDKAKIKLRLHGGKLSTLFNLYLSDFVESMDKGIADSNRELALKVKELEARLKKIEEE